MYPNQRTTNKRRRSRMNRAAAELAMSTCALLQSGGYQIIAAHCINNSPRIIVEAQRGRRAGAFDPRASQGDQIVSGVHVEWRVR